MVVTEPPPAAAARPRPPPPAPSDLSRPRPCRFAPRGPRPTRRPRSRAPRPAAPGLLVDALAGARYTGPTRALMMGAELRAAMVFGRWLAGLSARYDSAVSVFQPVPDQFSLSSVSVGLPVGYRIAARARRADGDRRARRSPSS